MDITKRTETLRLLKRTLEEAVDNLAENYQGVTLDNINITVDKDSGEVVFFDDRENRVADIVIFDWVEKGEQLTDLFLTSVLREVAEELIDVETFDKLLAYKPFTLCYVDDNFELIEELTQVEDEADIELEESEDLMKKFDEDFDNFLDKLLKE